MKKECIFLIRYFKKINFGGEETQTIWDWQLSMLEKIEEESVVGKMQIKYVYKDCIEFTKDFSIPILKDMLLDSFHKGISLELGKTKELKVFKACLNETDTLTPEEEKLTIRLYYKYSSKVEISDSQKKYIESLINKISACCFEYLYLKNKKNIEKNIHAYFESLSTSPLYYISKKWY